MPSEHALRLAAGITPLAGVTNEVIDVGATAVGPTPATVGNATSALFTAEGAEMRFWDTGSTPTATAGHLLYVGDVREVEGNAAILQMKFIRTGGSNGKIMASYYS